MKHSEDAIAFSYIINKLRMTIADWRSLNGREKEELLTMAKEEIKVTNYKSTLE